MHEESADVADPFAEGAEEHGEQVGPGAVADAEDKLEEEAQEEEGAEEGVGPQDRVVAVGCVGDGAGGGHRGAVVGCVVVDHDYLMYCIVIWGRGGG